MRSPSFGFLVAVTALILAPACSKSSPAAPSATAAAVAASDSSLTASIGAPRPLTPANGALVKNLDQPVTLVVQNGVSTKAGATYTFEVATDAGFLTKAPTKDGVAEGASGQTSVKLDPLPAAKDYYWHARMTSGGTTGLFGTTYKFSVGPAITINAPTPASPANGAATSDQPALTVTNATRSGPAGPIFYRFDISNSSSFGTIVATATVAEQTGQTSYTPTVLAGNTTFFWRVTAADPANAITSPASSAQSFTTSLAIDLTKVVYLNSPDVSGWRQTGRLTQVEQDGAGNGPMCMSFTDPGWPDSHWPYGRPGDDPNFGVFANQWYFANIGGVWYGGAGVCKAGQGTRTIGPDSGFGNPFSSWVPKPGELVGFMVSSVARAGAVKRTVDERTNVVVQPWHDSALQGFIAVPLSRR